MVLITLGEQGMMLFEHRQNRIIFRPKRARSSMFRARAIPPSRCSPWRSAAVRPAGSSGNCQPCQRRGRGKLGTATVSPRELIASFENDG